MKKTTAVLVTQFLMVMVMMAQPVSDILLDVRDGHKYNIRLLADGRWWMTQDLRYGCKASDTLCLYNWTSAMNLQHSTYASMRGCGGRGAAANACGGVCPRGWHLPTLEEFFAADEAFGREYACTLDSCWNAGSLWQGTLRDGEAMYWNSTAITPSTAYSLVFSAGVVDIVPVNKAKAVAVRCVKNE